MPNPILSRGHEGDTLTIEDVQALQDAVAHLLAAADLIRGVVDPASPAVSTTLPVRKSVAGIN